MKIKIIITSILTSLLAFNFSFAQIQPNSCLDLKFNMKPKSRDRNTKGEVTKLQNFLIQNEYLIGVKSNGNYGPATIKAVKEFQEANNLIVTGIVGKITREKLRDVSCAVTFQNTSTGTSSKLRSSNTFTIKDGPSKEIKNKTDLLVFIQGLENSIQNNPENNEECQKDNLARVQCEFIKSLPKSIRIACLDNQLISDNKISECVSGVMIAGMFYASGF